MIWPLWETLPNGWRTGQVKHTATVTLGKMLQTKDSGSDVEAPYMRAANVQPDGVLALDDVNEMWFGEVELEQLSIQAGDVVVVEGGQGGFGRAAYVDKDLLGWGFQNSINRLRPIGDFDGRFTAFYLIALRASGFIRAYANVVSMPHLTAEKLARIPIPLPPPEEQRAIADYLEREIARIDTLIEEQQRLIEMLRERRAAAIATCLESLGGMTRLKHVSTVQTGVTLSGEGDLADPEWPYLRVANVQVGHVDLREIKTVRVRPDKAAMSMLQPGDVLVTEGGDIDKLGRGALWRGELPDMLHQNHIFAVRPDKMLDSEFLVYWLDGPVARTYFRTTAKQTTNLAGTNKWTLGNLPVPAPPLNEQRRLVETLHMQTAQIDALIAETERFIELAREHKAALITAAVTGQIDAREMA
jgi:type I restriction enzyme S subunit